MWDKMFQEQGPLSAFILILAMFAGALGAALLIGAYGNRDLAGVRWHLAGWGAGLLAVAGALCRLGFWIMP